MSRLHDVNADLERPGAVRARAWGAAAADPLELLGSLEHRRRGGSSRGTHRARALCEELGAPHLALSTVHVAGTNGKTSVVRMAVSLLVALGVHVGDTTSPHLHHVGERIRIDGRPASTRALARATRDLPSAIDRAEVRVGEPVTFFDAVTAVALRTFVQEGCGLGVVEAGIGGAGDATDVVAGPVSVLTPIGLDHRELGATSGEVAANKAGIIRPGGTVLSAVQPHGASQVVAQVATRRGARLLQAGRDFGVIERRVVDGGQAVVLAGLGGRRLRCRLPLHGARQADNAALALAAVQVALATTELDPARLRAGFAAVRVPGRVELLERSCGPLVVLDGAHDAQASSALASTLHERFAGRPIVVVIGTSAGRDPVPVLSPLRSAAATVAAPIAVATAADVPGVSPPELLASRLRSAGWDAEARPDVGDALARAADRVGPDGVLVVTGSMYVVGAARARLTASLAHAAEDRSVAGTVVA